MSRVSRVPYHQNVYDLLGIEPGECPEAARMIAEHEAQHGPLPASVREWYSVPNVVLLDRRPQDWLLQWELNHGKLCWEYSNQDPPVPLLNFLDDCVRLSDGPEPPFVAVIHENQGVVTWLIEIDGSDDPPVWIDNDQPDDPTAWTRTAPSFSEFFAQRFGYYYRTPWTPLSRNSSDARFNKVAPLVKPHHNGLWLRTTDEPLQPPVIDFLTDHFGEPERTSRPGNVTTHTVRPVVRSASPRTSRLSPAGCRRGGFTPTHPNGSRSSPPSSCRGARFATRSAPTLTPHAKCWAGSKANGRREPAGVQRL